MKSVIKSYLPLHCCTFFEKKCWLDEPCFHSAFFPRMLNKVEILNWYLICLCDSFINSNSTTFPRFFFWECWRRNGKGMYLVFFHPIIGRWTNIDSDSWRRRNPWTFHGSSTRELEGYCLEAAMKRNYIYTTFSFDGISIDKGQIQSLP